MSGFKVGDKVQVRHNAWSKVLNGPFEGRRVTHQHSDGSICKYIVVAVGCKIPIEQGNTANTLLMGADFIPHVFIGINDCNIAPYIADINVRFASAGRDITAKLSEESKKEILRAHLER